MVSGNDPRGPGSLDRRINSAIELEGVTAQLGTIESCINRQQTGITDCLNALIELRSYSAKQASVDKIERMLGHNKEDLSFSGDSHGGQERLEKRLNTILEFLKKEEKTLATMMKNSDSDAKSFSQCNTALQGLKSSVSANGKQVILAINVLGDQLTKINETVDEVKTSSKTDCARLEGTLDDMNGSVRKIENNVVEEGEARDKLQAGLEKLERSVRSLEKSGRLSSGSRKSTEKESSPINDVFANDDARQQLEEINNNHTKFQEEFKTSIISLKSEVKKTDTNVGNAIKNLSLLLKSSVEIQKQTKLLLPETEKKLLINIKELKEEVSSHQDVKPGSSSSSSDSSGKLDLLEKKLDKLGKSVSRVKYLVEPGDSDEENGKGGKRKKRFSTDGPTPDISELERLVADLSSKLDGNILLTRLECLDDKLDKINRGSSDKKIEDLAFKLTSMEESISRRIEDDLSANVEKVDKMSELVQEVKNIVHEVGDRMITTKTFTTSQSEMRRQILQLNTSIAGVPDEFGGQLAAMEENLCRNVESTVREVFKHHWDELMKDIEQILGKLSTIKRFVKFRSREGSVEGDETETPTLETTINKINEVAERVSVLHTALESGVLSSSDHQEPSSSSSGTERQSLGSALILEEIRKKPDVVDINSLKKEMFTAVHNVQNRLLEEQVEY